MIASNCWILICQTEQKVFRFSLPFLSHYCESQLPPTSFRLPALPGSPPLRDSCCIPVNAFLAFCPFLRNMNTEGVPYISVTPPIALSKYSDGNATFLSFLSG